MSEEQNGVDPADSSDPGSAEAEADVRNLLADLGTELRNTDPADTDLANTDDGTVPEDVLTRLDDTLARLVAERTADTNVTSLAARNDSRPTTAGERVRRGWLAAAGIAAATVLAAVAVPQVLSGGDDGNSPTASQSREGPSDASAETRSDDVLLSGLLVDADRDLFPADGLGNEELGEEELGDEHLDADGSAAREFGARTEEHGPYSSLPSRVPMAGTPEINSATLADDVLELLSSLPTFSASSAQEGSGQVTSGGAAVRACTWDGAGTPYDVSLDGRRALAVVTGSQTTGQTVRLVVCDRSGETVEMATAVVPAP